MIKNCKTNKTKFKEKSKRICVIEKQLKNILRPNVLRLVINELKKEAKIYD